MIKGLGSGPHQQTDSVGHHGVLHPTIVTCISLQTHWGVSLQFNAVVRHIRLQVQSHVELGKLLRNFSQVLAEVIALYAPPPPLHPIGISFV